MVQVVEERSVMLSEDEYEDLIQRSVETGWRALASAPKDRTHILMLTDKGIVEAFWAVGAYSYEEDAHVGGWVNEFEGIYEEMNSRPVAWVPLPDPPEWREL